MARDVIWAIYILELCHARTLYLIWSVQPLYNSLTIIINISCHVLSELQKKKKPPSSGGSLNHRLTVGRFRKML